MTLMRKVEREEARLLGAFALGALVGAAAALLLTPESGERRRARLGHWLHGHHLTGHDLYVKLKKLLAVRHDGSAARHAVDGRTTISRRHKRL